MLAIVETRAWKERAAATSKPRPSSAAVAVLGPGGSSGAKTRGYWVIPVRLDSARHLVRRLGVSSVAPNVVEEMRWCYEYAPPATAGDSFVLIGVTDEGHADLFDAATTGVANEVADEVVDELRELLTRLDAQRNTVRGATPRSRVQAKATPKTTRTSKEPLASTKKLAPSSKARSTVAAPAVRAVSRSTSPARTAKRPVDKAPSSPRPRPQRPYDSGLPRSNSMPDGAMPGWWTGGE